MSDYHDPANVYLENNVLTATPQRLRLMLIEAGLRLAQQVIDLWQTGQKDAGVQALIRTQAIVSELHGSVRAGDSELANQVAAMYLVMYRSLVEAQLDADVARVESVVRGLAEDRETWRQLCENSPEVEPLPGANGFRESNPPPGPYFDDLTGSEGLSIEA
jgi:flagellar secretion chaperone FliS